MVAKIHQVSFSNIVALFSIRLVQKFRTEAVLSTISREILKTEEAIL